MALGSNCIGPSLFVPTCYSFQLVSLSDSNYAFGLFGLVFLRSDSTNGLFFFFLIYFWLRWVSAAVQVSLVAASRGYLLVMVHRLLIAMTSVVVAPGL